MLHIELKRKANQIRRHVLEMVYTVKSGHIGGSLSSADIMTYLYFQEMNIDPEQPNWVERDRFVLSKGHVTPVYYATLAERGFFPLEDLLTFRKADSYLQGHPNMNKVPGVDMSTGSLGQGVSVAVGMALGIRFQGGNSRVYTLMGDGELGEGQIWEAFMFAGNQKLSNLVVIIDNNDLQCDGHLEEVNSPYPIDKKLEDFHFHVQVIDGHSFEELERAFAAAREHKTGPTAIIAKTTKGKGVSFMENRAEWHGSVPNAEQFSTAMNELCCGNF